MLRNFFLIEKRLNTKRSKTTGDSRGSSTHESTDQTRNFEKTGTEFFNKWLKPQKLLLECKYFPQNEAENYVQNVRIQFFLTNQLQCPNVLPP